MNTFKKITRYSKTVALLCKALDSYVMQPDIRGDLDLICSRYSASALSLRESATLNLGCGAQPKILFKRSSSMAWISAKTYQIASIMPISQPTPSHSLINLITGNIRVLEVFQRIIKSLISKYLLIFVSPGLLLVQSF